MMYDVPRRGRKWLTTQHPACEFHAGDIKTMHKYLKMLHKQKRFMFVNECEIYHADDQDCVGFCVEEGCGCGNTAGMIEDIAYSMCDEKIGKNTPFNLAQVDMMRMRILTVNITNHHYAGHCADPLDRVYKMYWKIEAGRDIDEKEEISDVRSYCLSEFYKRKHKKY